MITFKPGASFEFTWVFTPGTDGAASFAGCAVASAILLQDGTYVPLAADLSDDNLSITVTSPDDLSTAGWATGKAYWDIMVVNGDGKRLPTVTVEIDVGTGQGKRVTR